MTPMEVKPVELRGETVMLRPLRAEDAPGLWAVTPRETFTHYFTRPTPWGEEGFRKFVEFLLAAPRQVPFTVVQNSTGGLVGCTSILDINPDYRTLEIGYTWYTPSARGTRVNPECKYLLMRHAFETLGALRIALKTDVNNLHSQRAIEKLGAVREGIIRRNAFRPEDNYRRDSVLYSVIVEEWPAVSAGLLARLGPM